MRDAPAAAGLAGRRVLLTGASGFLGSHLARRLVAANAEVHALTRRLGAIDRLHDIAEQVTFWPGDVTDFAACLSCVKSARADVVIHLAADTSVRRLDAAWDAVDRGLAVNLVGTVNMLRATAQGGDRASVFVRAGGLEEYGNAAIPFDEAARERPSSPYSASQVAATHYTQMLQPHVEFAAITLRLALVYGPDQSTDFFIPSLITSCLTNTPFEMTSGEQKRELLHVDDAVDALCAAAVRPDLRGTVINVGPGTEYGIREVAELILELTGASRDQLRVGAAPSREAELLHLVGRSDRARELLDWAPRTGLREGLERTIHWYRDNLQTLIARRS